MARLSWKTSVAEPAALLGLPFTLKYRLDNAAHVVQALGHVYTKPNQANAVDARKYGLYQAITENRNDPA